MPATFPTYFVSRSLSLCSLSAIQSSLELYHSSLRVKKVNKHYKLIINLGQRIARTKYFAMYEEVSNLSKIPSILIKFIFENFKCKLIEDFNLCSDNGHIF